MQSEVTPCPGCGYDLRGSAGERCPECGLEIDRTSLGESRIPWSHRRKIGRWRAYWSTVRLAARHPRRLAEEIARPVSFEDAVRFRRVTALLAFVPAAGFVVYLYLLSLKVGISLWFGPWWGTGMQFGEREPAGNVALGEYAGWVLEWSVLLALLVGLWLLVLSAAGVASYFFHPRRLPLVQQNRATALSYYACAPLALTPLTAALAACFTVIVGTPLGETFAWVQVGGSLLITAEVIAMIQVLLWYVGTLVLLRRTTQCGAGRVFTAAVSLPAMCLLLGVLTLVVIPAAVAFVALVILSLT